MLRVYQVLLKSSNVVPVLQGNSDLQPGGEKQGTVRNGLDPFS